MICLLFSILLLVCMLSACGGDNGTAEKTDLKDFPYIGTWVDEDGKVYLRVKDDGVLLSEVVLTTSKTTTIDGITSTNESKSLSTITYTWSVEKDMFLFSGVPFTPTIKDEQYCLVGKDMTYYRVGELDYDIPLDDTGAEDQASVTTKPLSIGETVTTDDYELTVNSIDFSYEVSPSDTSGVYTSYPADSGKVYIDIKANFKNLMPRDILIKELPTATVTYNDQYKYTGFAIVDRGNSFDWARNYVVATPLSTEIIHILVECPKEVATSDGSVVVSIMMGQTAYEFALK